MLLQHISNHMGTLCVPKDEEAVMSQTSTGFSHFEKRRTASMKEVRKLLDGSAVLPLWPEVGSILGLSRGATYDAAAKGDIRTVDMGRLKKVPTPWLRQILGLDEKR
jgi:hypothetical protein